MPGPEQPAPLPTLPPAADAVDVLLVDDQPANLLAMEAVLADLPLNPIRAATGEEALRVLADRDVAVVVLDVLMPGLDGFETARRARALDRARHTPIVFLTARDDDRADAIEAYRLGAVDYLIKPVVPEILRAKVGGLADLFREKERARREADLLRLFIQGTTDYAIFMLDPAGRIATWNAGAQRLKGYAAAEITGRHFSTFYPKEAVDRGWPDEELRRATAGGRFEDEGWRVRKDGSTFWANVVITALRDAHGHLKGFSKVTRDLTERREREEALRRLSGELERRVEERTVALRESEERFRVMADGIQQLAWMARPDGHIFWYNTRWHEYTGTTPAEMEGWGWQTVHDPEVLPGVVRRWRQSLATGEPFDMVFPLRGKDGTFRPFLTRVMPQRDASGAVVRWFGTNTDISEQMAAEAALRDRDRRKDEFLAMLAHELRNPLAPIQNALHVLQLRKDEATVEQVRVMVSRQVGQLTHLVNDLLEASRVTAGKIVLRRELLDLAQLARVVANDHASVVEAAGVELVVHAPETPAWVSGDWTRLTQVVGNLLQNAAKFTPRGGRVTIDVRADGPSAVLSVRDTGIGIEPDLLGRLFTPFTQADQGLARRHGGLGLGLALVKGLTDLHGGTVTAESDGPGQGATFTVRLPRVEEPAAVRGSRPAGPGVSRGLRVLIVEDNPDAAESLRMVLELGGCQVTVANTGPDGVAAAKRVRPQLVLCDIGLPGFSGFEVARRIRAEANGSVVLIALTGYGRDEDREEARAAGFNWHFTKPVDFQQLEAVLTGVGPRAH